MPDRVVPAGLTNYSVRPTSTVRFFATARGLKSDGTTASAAEVWHALTNAGFGKDLQVWTQGTARPGDWPQEPPDMAPPVSLDDTIVLRGEGSWPGAAIPSAIRMQLGPAIQFWRVWEHTELPSQVASGQLLGEPGPARTFRMGILTGFLMGVGIGLTKGPKNNKKR